MYTRHAPTPRANGNDWHQTWAEEGWEETPVDSKSAKMRDPMTEQTNTKSEKETPAEKQHTRADTNPDNNYPHKRQQQQAIDTALETHKYQQQQRTDTHEHKEHFSNIENKWQTM